MPVATFTKSGTKAASAAALPKAIFSEEIKTHDLMHQAYVAGAANRRANGAHTLTRGEVRGGGRKPWRQKGTGRARHGSIRSPIWRGGGVTFGPSSERNYTKSLTAAAKRKAVRQALTLSASDGSLSVIEEFSVKDGKTRTAEAVVRKLNLALPLLLVVDRKTDETARATRNLADVTLVTARYLSVYNLANHASILLTKPAVAAIDQWLKAPKKTEDQP
jgi:large subunit ribosomal protein L4